MGIKESDQQASNCPVAHPRIKWGGGGGRIHTTAMFVCLFKLLIHAFFLPSIEMLRELKIAPVEKKFLKCHSSKYIRNIFY